MITRDNFGNIVAETNIVRTNDGATITTNTMFYNNRPIAQNISIRDSQGRVETKNLIGGKLLP